MEHKKMSVSAAQKKATAKYLKESMVQVTFRANKRTDADVLKYLDTIDNKRAYLLALIRKDMAEKGFTDEQK